MAASIARSPQFRAVKLWESFEKMSRHEDLKLLHEYTQSQSLIRHMLAVEAAVRAYAVHFGEDADKWGTVGLMHDFDYERWPDPPDHPLQGAEILKQRGYSSYYWTEELCVTPGSLTMPAMPVLAVLIR